VRTAQNVFLTHQEDGALVYTIYAADFNVEEERLSHVTVTYYETDTPAVLLFAERAIWDQQLGRWKFFGATARAVKDRGPALWLVPSDERAELNIEAYVMQVKETPFQIAAARKEPEELTSSEMQQYIHYLQKMGTKADIVNEWAMGLAHRFSIPFSCLVFALIGAPLGLRSHRTSSSIGLGISLLIIFGYYVVFHYLGMFGEGGNLPPVVAAWLPNILGGLLGIVLLLRANR
jgi:lipopolysaccharide export system permease protein